MFIHLGGDTLVSSRAIVALINLEDGVGPNSTQDFIKRTDLAGKLKKLESSNYKSLVITKQKIYLSPISTLTLRKRADFIDNLEMR